MKKRSPTSCPIVFSLDLFGDKWSLVILRDILFSDKSHFRELQASDEKIATNILSNRLEDLVASGMLTKKTDPANKSAAIYAPTKKTIDLLPMLIELMRWGAIYNANVDKTIPVMKQVASSPQALATQIAQKFGY